jgi:hypothetical protein
MGFLTLFFTHTDHLGQVHLIRGDDANYDTVITYESVQIHKITSRNFNYFRHKLNLPIFWV